MITRAFNARISTPRKKKRMNQIDSAISHTVSEEQEGERFDRLLARSQPKLSRSRIQALIKEGCTSVDGETITNPSYRVKHGQQLLAIVPPVRPTTVIAQVIPLVIPFEDNDLLIVDKPAGIAVHPAPGTPDSTLVNALLAHCGDSLSGIGGERRPGIVHRLDKGTSGLIVVAKNDTAHAALSAQFQARDVERSYAAVVWGTPSPRDGEIVSNIGRSSRDRKKMAVVSPPKGRNAITRYRTERAFDSGESLLECRLGTGRTHQIRVHMTDLGHALIGDQTYGRNTNARLKRLSAKQAETIQRFPRQALHAQLLGFIHPTRHVPLRFKSALPYDMIELIGTLEDV
jgi:23S rRNA pseudouridine1911/1915/1917 synthase